MVSIGCSKESPLANLERSFGYSITADPLQFLAPRRIPIAVSGYPLVLDTVSIMLTFHSADPRRHLNESRSVIRLASFSECIRRDNFEEWTLWIRTKGLEGIRILNTLRHSSSTN